MLLSKPLRSLPGPGLVRFTRLFRPHEPFFHFRLVPVSGWAAFVVASRSKPVIMQGLMSMREALSMEQSLHRH